MHWTKEINLTEEELQRYKECPLRFRYMSKREREIFDAACRAGVLQAKDMTNPDDEWSFAEDITLRPESIMHVRLSPSAEIENDYAVCKVSRCGGELGVFSRELPTWHPLYRTSETAFSRLWQLIVPDPIYAGWRFEGGSYWHANLIFTAEGAGHFATASIDVDCIYRAAEAYEIRFRKPKEDEG